MKKREITTLIGTITLVSLSILSKTTHIFILALLALLVLTSLFYYISYLKLEIELLYLAQKYYRTLVKKVDYIKYIEELKYKSYFVFKGKDLEDKINICDRSLDINNKLGILYIKFLKHNKKFLSKKQFNTVIEISKNTFPE